MTPDIIKTLKSDNYHIELSSGSSILKGETLYGVTVSSAKSKENIPHLSKPFRSRKEAEAYMNTLK